MKKGSEDDFERTLSDGESETMSGGARSRSEEISSRSLGSLVNPGNVDDRKEVVLASRKLVRPASGSEVGYSQASRQENVPLASRKTGAGGSNPNRQ